MNIKFIIKKMMKVKLPLAAKIILGIAGGILALVLLFNLALYLIPYPGLEEFKHRQYSTRFFDRDGKLLQVLALEEGLHREYYPLEKYPKELLDEFVLQEDKNFYSHNGVDAVSVIRAMMQNKKAGTVVSGASTITMQLVRIISPRKERVTVGKKIVEAFKALHLEKHLSKDEILELYINNVPFGYQCEGAASAARTFYGITPGHLTDKEIKELAKIPRRPSDYKPAKLYEYPFEIPHYINHLVGEYKSRKEVIPPELHLAIDSKLAKKVITSINSQLHTYQDARIHNGAAYVINNITGETVLWIGNSDFYDDQHSGQIDGVTVKNQPGSSMKPFLYALALENGFSPNSILPDIPQDFGGKGVYVPQNFNNQFNGPVRFRVALASSLNVPAVYLLYHMGVDRYMAKLEELGFESLRGTRESTGLSLALGSSEVTLYEMVNAFSTFVNDGKFNGHQVYQKDTARIMCSILSDKNARELGFGHAKVFDTPYPSIFKTGTSNQFQNIIAIGATSKFTAGVWMGNFDGETVVRKTGSSIPALVVREILDALTERYGCDPFAEPEKYQKVKVCTLSGLAPSEACPSVAWEYVLKTAVPNMQTCNWHSLENGHIKITYPSEYQHWAYGRNINATDFFSDGEFEIMFPKNEAVFIFDPGIPENVQELMVIASGGKEREAFLSLDGKPVAKKEMPFSWNLPLTRGEHLIEISCGSEKDSVKYTVK
ncbi:transglycosylase domain-containing protein [Treponema sp.]|uniref:transglycosylase domain-containing protein n=1 Tax=Treponema sp. TaxID=166 RepID=UPI0025FDD248|nr:transglycosylase domain-containing protein [Treponema sp.]MCR5218028.1 transglycosylase domain-containing protein [Treponema sp.]